MPPKTKAVVLNDQISDLIHKVEKKVKSKLQKGLLNLKESKQPMETPEKTVQRTIKKELKKEVKEKRTPKKMNEQHIKQDKIVPVSKQKKQINIEIKVLQDKIGQFRDEIKEKREHKRVLNQKREHDVQDPKYIQRLQNLQKARQKAIEKKMLDVSE